MNLDNVQVGDTLIQYGFYDPTIVQVERTTKTQIITGGKRFKKSTGSLVGGSTWQISLVSIPKEGEIDEINRKKYRRNLEKEVVFACQLSSLQKMPLETLQQVHTLLE